VGQRRSSVDGDSVKLLTDLFSEKDNDTYCVVTILMSSGGVAMLYNFITLKSADWQGLGVGLAALAAGIAAKRFTEEK